MNARLEDFVKDTNELNQTLFNYFTEYKNDLNILAIQLEVEHTDIFQSMSVLSNQAADAMQKALNNNE